VSQFAIPGAGFAHSGGSAGGIGSPLYVACNSGIASPTSSVYYNGSVIAAGFDGNRVGFANQNGFMWIMNLGNQGRHSAATGWQAWNLSAPPASPYALGGATAPNAFDVTYTYNLVGDPTYLHYLAIAGVVYSIPENGYSAQQIPLVLAGLASGDANCSVTYDGSSQQLYIQAIAPNTRIAVAGSDGNPSINLANGAVSTLPNGAYRYYLTFMSSDLTLESNPSPVSNVSSVVSQPMALRIPGVDGPTDARVGFLNVYRTGGTMSAPYRVGSIPVTLTGTWSPTTTYPVGTTVSYNPVGNGSGAFLYTAIAANTNAEPDTATADWTQVIFVDSMSDLTATDNGQTMPIAHDGPPACAGIIGPFLSRLYSWSDAAHKNRLYYTPADLPQYWNTDPQVGDWFDVGQDDENIVWCTIHSNLLVIYKERSIWVLIGDPLTGQIEQMYDGFGLVNAFALASAGQIDYFVGPGGLNVFDMAQVHAISGNILPLFNRSITNAGPLTPPGSILPGSAFNGNSTSSYAIALGHAMGRLYIAYAEQQADF
jgi:hypothetical protein